MSAPFIELRICTADTERCLITAAGEPVTIGQDTRCQVVIDNPKVALRQARLISDANGALILEAMAASDNLEPNDPILINGNPVRLPVTWCPGETLAIAQTRLTWRNLAPEETPTIAIKCPNETISSHQLAELAEQTPTRYERDAEIGRGGMGKVFSANDKVLRRTVALKVLRDTEDIAGQTRFIREARITGTLQHPSIVPVHELSLDQNGHAFYTMKLAKGMTLLQILHNLATGKTDASESYRLAALLTIFQKVCDAVAFAHSQPQPVIHRDLKPENIMVGDYGEVLVMDWGAAKILDGNGDEPNEQRSGTVTGSADSGLSKPSGGSNATDHREDVQNETFVTQPGSVMGTPGYMAPEQASGRAASADERTDIYALGAILSALLTLDAPLRVTPDNVRRFEESRARGEDIDRKWQEHVVPLLADRSARPRLKHLPHGSIPESLAAVALKAMALRPADRYASVKELQTDVAAYQSGFATSAEEANSWRRFKLLVARHRVLSAAIVAIFAILLAATVVSLEQRAAAIESNRGLQLTLKHASLADLEAARQRFQAGAWREGVALVGRSLTFWPDNRAAGNYLLSAIAFGRGDRDKLPIFGVYHSDELEEAAFSPDGRSFVTASDDKTARIWDSSTGAPLVKPLQHPAPVWCARFSPDGTKVATSDEKGLVRLWDSRTGDPVAKPMQHGRPDLDSASTVETLVFSRDGQYLLTGCWDHTARLWSVKTGNQVAELVGPHRISDAIYSPDETRILTCYWEGGAILWDAKTLHPIGAPMTHGATVRRALFTPDGNRIVTASLDNSARIWDGHTARPLSPPIQHSNKVFDLDISPDGALLATACRDNAARLWSLDDASPRGVPMEHQGPVNTAIFSPDGKRLVTSSSDKTVRLWDVATCKQIGHEMHHDDQVFKAIFAPDGRSVLSIGADNAAYLWKVDSDPRPGEPLPIPGRACYAEFVKGSDDQVFVATKEGNAGLWSLSKRQFVTPVVRDAREVSLVAYHPETNRFATAASDGIIHFWNAATGKELGESKSGKDSFRAIEFATDGQSLFADYDHQYIERWAVLGGNQIRPILNLPTNTDSLAAAPNGRELAIGCGIDLVQFWDPSSAKMSHKPIRYNAAAAAISYSPDGNLIVTGCHDQMARIWSVASRQQQGEPFHAKGRVTDLHFTADGKALLVGAEQDPEVNCYDIKTHNGLYISLPHPTGVSHITSNADGSKVITVTNDGVARLWRVPTTSEPPPRWLPDYLRALGGLTFSPQQKLTEVPTRERLALRQRLLEQPPDGSVWDRMMRSSFHNK